MKKGASFILLLLISLTTFSLLKPPAFSNAQALSEHDIAEQKAQELFQKMTPAERVGQLFLVSFEGSSIDINSKIYDLILNYHIGGVILMSKNNNFTDGENTINNAYGLISDLQQIEWFNSYPESLESVKPNPDTQNYIPLFIAISQEGDGYPYDQILSGLTPLPSQMAIGATWSTDLASGVGEILGSELSALGINLLFGPSLDVLDLTFSGGNEGLGTRSFGENPYWVGKLGSAFIEGVHLGSQDQILVIAKHFPGRGSSDRNPSQEIATVRKSYNLLVQTDLAPFMAVTGLAKSEQATADGLLTSHIRYEGFQGTIRNTTRPISFDATAMEQLLALPAFANWRQDGGLIVSDNLGSQAMRSFYDPNGVLFDARQIARNAINAGADLLYLDNFVATGDGDQYTTIIRTLDFFVQKYMEDEAFAQRVNSSVLKILMKKFTIYPEFEISQVLTPEEELATVNQANPIIFDVAQQSVTLLSPRVEEFSSVIPNPPGINDRTVFFTDVQYYKQCTTCKEVEMITTDALRRSIVRLYGPEASGDIAQYLLSTFSFADLNNFLDGVGENSQVVEEELRAADWVVFAFMDTNSNRPASFALKRLLAEQPELLTNKNSIAFAFNAPHYLDSTEISKLSAYYAIYSKIPSFTEVASRVLFQEIIPSGALPISLPAIGYNLVFATSPNPNQTISLMLDTSFRSEEAATSPSPTVTNTGEPIPVPSFKTGDTLPLKTGIILDRYNHPVPDGTTVNFIFTLEGDPSAPYSIETKTKDGVARVEYLIQREGRLVITATSNEARNSDILSLNITKDEAAVITVIIPTPTPTLTPTPTETLIPPSPTPTETPVIIPPEPRKTSGADWLLSMLIVFGCSAGIALFGRSQVDQRWGIRWGLLAAFGGMLAYTILSLNTPATRSLVQNTGFTGIFFSLLIGIGTGWLGAWLWYRDLARRKKKLSSAARSPTGSTTPKPQ